LEKYLPHLFICQSERNLSKQSDPGVITASLVKIIYIAHTPRMPTGLRATASIYTGFQLVLGHLMDTKAQPQLTHTIKSHLAKCG